MRLGKAIAVCALVCGMQLTAAASTQAARIIPAVGSIAFTGGSGMTLFGSGHSIDTSSLGRGQLPAVHVETPPATTSSVPEPAGWLTMLLGFGLLGAVTRRGARTPMETQREL